ncbi:hypothetical protein PIB30_064701 [Stylosanthes scabra]|uniref:Uncharacterized protein n=1 Tax=Stylosanthes scabra TaxID=79078 RepID=A0ABU6ZKF7_9FABA|nr:hypothetical protein [Stylosanthes scabra]
MKLEEWKAKEKTRPPSRVKQIYLNKEIDLSFSPVKILTSTFSHLQRSIKNVMYSEPANNTNKKRKIEDTKQHRGDSNNQTGPEEVNPIQINEEYPNKQMSIKEVLKQVLKNEINKFVNQEISDSDLWTYREKPKMLKTWHYQGRNMIMRKPPDMQYTVEFPEEDEDMPDSKYPQKTEGNQQEDLAHKIRCSLQIKRQREEDCQLLLEDATTAPTQTTSYQPEVKKKKGDDAEDMDEEAGPSTPHPQP